MEKLLTTALQFSQPGQETPPVNFPNERAAIEAQRRLKFMIKGAACAWLHIKGALLPVNLVVEVRQRIERVARSPYTLGAAGSPDWELVITAY